MDIVVIDMDMADMDMVDMDIVVLGNWYIFSCSCQVHLF